MPIKLFATCLTADRITNKALFALLQFSVQTERERPLSFHLLIYWCSRLQLAICIGSCAKHLILTSISIHWKQNQRYWLSPGGANLMLNFMMCLQTDVFAEVCQKHRKWLRHFKDISRKCGSSNVMGPLFLAHTVLN